MTKRKETAGIANVINIIITTLFIYESWHACDGGVYYKERFGRHLPPGPQRRLL
jgi:hypothetical protein